MSNLYGVANAPQVCFITPSFAGPTTLNPNVMTPIFTSGNIVAPSLGWFQILVWSCIRVSNGASIPTGFAFAVAIGAGSFNTATQIGAQWLTPSGSNLLVMFTESIPAQAAWQGVGSPITLGLTAQTNGTTVAGDSNAMFQLIRTADQ